jgi:hypothetical protein
MVKPLYNPIWKDVGLPIVLAGIVAVSGWINWTKSEQVHQLVNSRVTKLQDDLATALAKIERLETAADIREDRNRDM